MIIDNLIVGSSMGDYYGETQNNMAHGRGVFVVNDGWILI